jgi:hypothetical protein
MSEISPTAIAAITKTDPNSRVAFQRRLTNLETYITNEVNPLEEQVINLKAKLIPHYDAVKMLRDEAREHCIHNDLIQQEDGSIKCKFCETIFHVNE